MFTTSSLLAAPRGLPRLAMLVALAIALCGLPAAQAQSVFCGAGSSNPESESSDADNAVSDLSLQHYANQPNASGLFCFYGYAAEKCGDHVTANRIYDRCIAAGHPGAMIWKALLLEDGNGVPRDPVQATALLRRAALSGSGGYAAIGKLHYASALYRGHGVKRNVPEAMRWFRRAAAEGNPEAQEFLRTGYHVGERDAATHGIGQRPPGSDAPLLADATASMGSTTATAVATHAVTPVRAVQLRAAVAPSATGAEPASITPPPAAPAAVVETGATATPAAPGGLHLALQEAAAPLAGAWREALVALLLLALVIGGGWWRQGRRQHQFATWPALPQNV